MKFKFVEGFLLMNIIDYWACSCKILYLSQVMRKPFFFAYAKTKTQISFAMTAKLISAFVFATWIIQSLYFLNLKFQASNHILCLYSPVCVGPCRKPRIQVFLRRGSFFYVYSFRMDRLRKERDLEMEKAYLQLADNFYWKETYCIL